MLLILAGITIQLVLTDGGIFNQAQRSKEQTRIGELLDKFNVSEATVALEKLGKPSLEDFINQVQNKEGYVIEAEKQEEGYYQVTTEDGYIFDVSIIEGSSTNDIIIEYVGKADGVIITARISGNNGWLKPGEASVMVTGKIKTYGGGTIVNVVATSNGTPIADFPTNGGEYVIDNITADTTIVITAMDSNGKSNTKTIPVIIKIDNIPPTVHNVTAMAEELKIKFSATGYDNESGLKHFSYTISPEEGLPTDKVAGTFLPGQEVEIISTTETTYTIAIKAIDNCNNITETPKTESVKTEKIILTVDQEVVYVGTSDTKKVTATIEASDIKNRELEWISNNPEIAEISQDGMITGKKVGTTTIMVRSKGNNNIYCLITAKVGETLDLDTIPLEYVDGTTTGTLSRAPLRLTIPTWEKWAQYEMSLPVGVTRVFAVGELGGPVEVGWLGVQYSEDGEIVEKRIFGINQRFTMQFNKEYVEVPPTTEVRLVMQLRCGNWNHYPVALQVNKIVLFYD